MAVLDAGLGGTDDAAVGQFALEQERTLVTIDSDFSGVTVASGYSLMFFCCARGLHSV